MPRLGAILRARFPAKSKEMVEKHQGLKLLARNDYPTPARRPANSVLSARRLTQDYGLKPRGWSAALSETLAALRAE
jgi:dTDP-4-dehydrorhamnose reductase